MNKKLTRDAYCKAVTDMSDTLAKSICNLTGKTLSDEVLDKTLNTVEGLLRKLTKNDPN